MIIHKGLLACSAYVSPKTGEVVKITPLGKLVYASMVSRNQYFTKVRGGEHFDTQQAIADYVGSEYVVVGRLIRGFEQNGLIDVEKRQIGGGAMKRNVYRRVQTKLKLVIQGNVQEIDISKLDNVKNHDIITPEYDEEFLASINFGG